VRKAIEIVQNRIPKRFGLDPARDVQVLCPMNRGSLGARALNAAVQAALNPAEGQPSVERFGYAYRKRPALHVLVSDGHGLGVSARHSAWG
jgi:exodeoxyribonuclease V alpha subunit